MKQRDWRLYFTAWFVISCVMGLFACVLYVPVPDGNKEIALTITGIIGGGFTTVLGYFFGAARKEKKE
jgi:uncharacterized membrane protein